MRALWICPTSESRRGGGGTVYGAGLQRALMAVLPELELLEEGSPGPRKKLPTRILRHLESLARSLVDGNPSSVLYHRYGYVASRINRLLKELPPYITFFDSTESIIYCSFVSGPKILIAHNIEGDIIRQKVAALPEPIQFILKYIFREVDKFNEFERSGAGLMDAIITISAIDKVVFSQWLPNKPVAHILPCFGSAAGAGKFRQKSEERDGKVRIAFPAKWSWAPNRGGYEWFAKEVWPFAASNAELHLFGQDSEKFTDSEQQIVGHGFVPSVEDIWRNADVAFVPTFSGGGLNIKMCEALYYGIPVISTPLAFKRLGFEPKLGVRKCENVEQWRSAMSKASLHDLVHEPPLASTSEAFSDEAAAEKIRELLDSVPRLRQFSTRVVEAGLSPSNG